MARQEGGSVWFDHEQKDLFQLILPLKPREKINKTDAVVAHHGYRADCCHMWPNRAHTGENYETCAWKQRHSRYEPLKITTSY